MPNSIWKASAVLSASVVSFYSGQRCQLEPLRHFCHLYSSVSCVNAIQKKQLQLHTFSSSCFSVTACLGRPICPTAVVPVGRGLAGNYRLFHQDEYLHCVLFVLKLQPSKDCSTKQVDQNLFFAAEGRIKTKSAQHRYPS